ncbi:MAG: choice-of-anchor J domain-containing protein [candidate division KSB1 bacterium]|nr:choice-of-anchor J domain-containing protein [candidate division KSB1 bacterium]MDZ7401074.1 choice-of-anchor J domain-containing protein [candidate division KSB1 bacterium]
MKTRMFIGLILASFTWLSALLGQDLTFISPQASKDGRLRAMVTANKLNTAIYDLCMRWRSEGLEGQNDLSGFPMSPLLQIDQQQVHVVLRTTAISGFFLKQLVQLGFKIEASTEHLPISSNHHQIVGWIPVAQLEKIAQLEQIFHIRPVLKPYLQSGEVVTAGDVILRADQARRSFQVSGIGQKIGILSDGCSHVANSQASGDLPRTIEIINNRFGGDAGTAMLEIVYDIAPGAQLAFADKGSSETDFSNNIKLLQQAGCTVICDDIIYPLEPVFEDGIIAQTINDLVENFNVVYITSAGDLQQDHYEADFSDGDNDGWHNFASGDETMNIQLGPKATITAVVQWNNQFSKARDDYDLYLYDDKLQSTLASSEDTQDGDDDPVEMLAYTNPRASSITVHLCLKKYRGQPRRITLYAFGTDVTPQEYTGGTGAIFGHSAAEHCLAVAAINAADTNYDTIESFSSRGPARIYQYDADGNPIRFLERNKPDHAAIDGVQTKVGKLGFFSNPFIGTSAAAAHSAGIAALLREAAPGLHATQIAKVLNDQSLDVGDPHFDLASGFGRVDAYQAINYVKGGAPSISVIPDSFRIDLIRGQSVIMTMTISNVGGSALDFSLAVRARTMTIANQMTNAAMASEALVGFPMDSDQTKWSINGSKKTDAIRSPKSKNNGNSYGDNPNNPLGKIARKTKPGETEPRGIYHSERIGDILLYEGFESGTVPPPNWTKIDGPSSPGGTQPAHWTIDSQSYVFSGNYSAVCYWGINLNEWLISPALDFSTVRTPSISFWWQSSYYWHVSPYDHGDLFLKISLDDGKTWQTLWTFGDIGRWEDFTWYYTIVDLSAFSGYSNVRLAFNVVASDNADIALDEVMVAGERVELGWLTLSPTAGRLQPDASQIIQLQVNSVVNGDTLGIGYYSATIAISSNDLDEPNRFVPVDLHIYTIADIDGRVSYYANSQMPVNDAEILLSGASNLKAISDSDGRYKFLGLHSGNYQVMPNKTNDSRDAITPLDASFALQYVVGVKQLSPYQKIAADVTGNGKVSAYDASYILQRVVGTNSQFPIGRDWTFVPHDFVMTDSNWVSAPSGRSYVALQRSQFNQDYFGILYGDVTGNWGRAEEESTQANVAVHLQDPLLQENAMTLVPLILNFSSPAFSGRLKLQYDSDNLKFCSGSLCENPDIVMEVHSTSNQIILAFAAGRSLQEQNLHIDLLFERSGLNVPSATDFKLIELVIDDAPAIIAASIDDRSSKLPKRWHLSQNQPNPFNAATIIHYEMPQSAKVTIEVMNVMGQTVRRLMDEVRPAGRYSIIWDGCDDGGLMVGSGIYFYKMTTTGFEAINKMVLVR